MTDSELLGDTGIRWSATTIRKAEGLVETEMVRRDSEHDDVFYVEGSNRNIYRVQTDGENFISCTCPNGMNQSRPHCYHTAAVLITIRDEAD